MEEAPRKPISLKNEVKTLGRHSLTYGLATVLSRVAGFFMIPLYTHYLGPNDYGILQLVGITIEAIGIVLGFGVAGAVYRYYFETKDPDQQKIVMSTAFLGVPFIAFAGFGLFATQSALLASLALESAGQWHYIVIALITLWFNQILELVSTYLRVKEQSTQVLLLSVSKLVVSLSLNIYFVAIAQIGVIGIFLSNMIAGGIFAICLYPVLLHKIGFSFSWPLARKMLRFGLPITPANLASLVVNTSDRFFLKAFQSLTEVGIYSLGYRLGSMVFYFVRVPFMQIWEPRRYLLFRDGASPEIFAKIATYFWGLMCFVGIAISILIKDVIKILSPAEYWFAAAIAPAVVLCYIIYAMDMHMGFGILVKKKTEYWTYVNLSVAALNLLLNYWWIGHYGMWGAVAATFVSVCLKIMGLHFISQKLFAIPFEWLRMAVIILLGMATYGLSLLWQFDNLVIALLGDGGFILIYLASLWSSGIIAKEEKNIIIQQGKKYLPLFSSGRQGIK